MQESQGGSFFSSDGGNLELVHLELPREAFVEPGACLRVSWFYGFGQTIQEVRRFNHPSCLRNRFFPKLVHPVFGVIGVPNSVAVDSEDLDARDGWILESRIDQQGGTEVGPLLVKPLPSRILNSASSHGFLHSVEITQESNY